MSKIIGYVVAIPFVLGLFFAAMGALIVLDGFIIRDIWNWHVSNTLGLKQLGIREAMGLSMAWNAFAFKAKGSKSQEGDAKRLLKNHLAGVVSLWVLAWAVFHWPWWGN